MDFLTRIFRGKAPFNWSQATKEEIGLQGEVEATRFLRKRGIKVLVTRYRCRFGEVDLVARAGDTLVFVEVKTRAASDYGDPALAVTPEKQSHISRVALHYLRALKNPEIPVRFDIVEVVFSETGVECHHIADAFSLTEPYIY
jgi:putative endonuclease